MTMLEIALSCIRRGWATFPCTPGTKKPRIPVEEGGHGYKDATLDEAQVRAWWAKWPNANVPVATGASGLIVLDIDAGLKDEASLEAWMSKHGMPKTFAVRSGSRPAFKVHLYYSQPEADLASINGWELDGCSGDIRCATGLVIAPGGQHKSGTPYSVLWDLPIVPTPESAKALSKKANTETPTEISPETAEEWKDWLWEYIDRNDLEPTGFEAPMPDGWKIGIVCPWSGQHSTEQGNSSTILCIRAPGKIVFVCSHGSCGRAGHNTAAFKQLMTLLHGEQEAEPGADPIAVLPGKTHLEPVISDWRELFHTRDEVLNCPPPTFLIDQFLQRQAICAIAAPVGQRKSIIALNVARSLTTKEPLFGVLPVLNQPSRVLYLCPEMGLVSLSERVRKIGVGDCIGDTLFVRSMNLGNLDLIDIPDAALDGSVLIVDTAIRFMSGDENSAKDTKGFSDILFNLQRRQGQDGAIVVLYHSPKATKDASELTLENCMRGSGELGAAITDAHGTRLQDASDGWTSESYIRHIKVRDYPGLEDFNVRCERETGVLVKTGDAGVKAVLSVNRGGYKSNLDGMDDAAKALIKANATMTVKALIKLLADNGIERGKTWVSDTRSEIRGCGAKRTE